MEREKKCRSEKREGVGGVRAAFQRPWVRARCSNEGQRKEATESPTQRASEVQKASQPRWHQPQAPSTTLDHPLPPLLSDETQPGPARADNTLPLGARGMVGGEFTAWYYSTGPQFTCEASALPAY